MVDNKINMSLDEIIKNERRQQGQLPGGSKQGNRRRAAAVAGRRNFRGGRGMGARRLPPRRDNNNGTQRAGSNLTTAAAIRVVNNLVKRAIQRRANQTLINRAAALRRRAVRGSAASRPAVGRRIRARGRAEAVGSRLAGRLSGVSQRSRVIAGGAARRARRQRIVIASPQIVRGRGVARMGQLVSDDDGAIVMEEPEIIRPVRQQQQQQVISRRIAARPREQVIVEDVVPRVVEQRPVIIRRGGIRKKRVILYDEPEVVPVNVPRRQARFRRNQPIFKRVQRVVEVRPRKRFTRVDRESDYMPVNPNAAQMRKALGIGVQRSRPERFESSSAFLQRVPVERRRGRGFQAAVY
ncbi:unnamed protein product [Gongylonema pulchrum]|uniref:FoP_duplication domain-containing protein n=1 Tax=Gongylonema pulchrum TaxID=637853 RepID=A0A183DZM1_9BILA|nr:unnamed protein product [Gongylonema pulchrum]